LDKREISDTPSDTPYLGAPASCCGAGPRHGEPRGCLDLHRNAGHDFRSECRAAHCDCTGLGGEI